MAIEAKWEHQAVQRPVQGWILNCATLRTGFGWGLKAVIFGGRQRDSVPDHQGLRNRKSLKTRKLVVENDGGGG